MSGALGELLDRLIIKAKGSSMPDNQDKQETEDEKTHREAMELAAEAEHEAWQETWGNWAVGKQTPPEPEFPPKPMVAKAETADVEFISHAPAPPPPSVMLAPAKPKAQPKQRPTSGPGTTTVAKPQKRQQWPAKQWQQPQWQQPQKEWRQPQKEWQQKPWDSPWADRAGWEVSQWKGDTWRMQKYEQSWGDHGSMATWSVGGGSGSGSSADAPAAAPDPPAAAADHGQLQMYLGFIYQTFEFMSPRTVLTHIDTLNIG